MRAPITRVIALVGTIALVAAVVPLPAALSSIADAQEAWPTMRDLSAFDARRSYVGSDACKTCHASTVNMLGRTAHTKKTQPANKKTLVMPAKNKILTTLDGNVMFKLRFRGRNNLFLTLYNLDGTGATEYRVERVMGGAGVAGKQRLIIRVGQDGKAVDPGAPPDGTTHLISPVQYDHHDLTRSVNDRFVAYHPEHWYDGGNLIGASVSRDAAAFVQPSQFKNAWERRCVGCHATGAAIDLDKKTGMFVNASSEYNVWCEACHGPGSDHVASVSAADIVNPANMRNAQAALDTCTRCHIRGSNVGEGNFGTGYPSRVRNNRMIPMPFGARLADWYTPGEGTWSSDDPQWGVAASLYNSSKKHHQQGFDFIQSSHWTGSEVRCWDCHNPHSGGAAAGQLVARADNNDLCLSCHASRFPDAAAVSAHTKHSNNPSTTGASRCVGCHMAKTAKSQGKWFTHTGDIATHTFDVIKPTLTARMARAGRGSVAAGSAIPNGCNACHMDDDNGVARWNRWVAARGGV